MEKKQIIVLAIALSLGIGLRFLRKYLAGRKKGDTKSGFGRSAEKKKDEDGNDNYEPYSGSR